MRVVVKAVIELNRLIDLHQSTVNFYFLILTGLIKQRNKLFLELICVFLNKAKSLTGIILSAPNQNSTGHFEATLTPGTSKFSLRCWRFRKKSFW